jgi:3-deoxy-D-arabino-heptulosonate 7-phosphate (DAHP) synthase
MKNTELSIIAGPCSIDEENIHEIHAISQIKVKNRPAIAGTRVVGLKSRTVLSKDGSGMGIDYEVFIKNLKILTTGGSINDLYTYPSVKMAKEIIQETNLLVATEIISPHIQMPTYSKNIKQGKVMFWTPAVEQLGCPVLEMVEYAKENNWYIGLKNGKWLDEKLDLADKPDSTVQTTMEKTWIGRHKYLNGYKNNILIQRGVDIPNKGALRNFPVHNIAKNTKLQTGAKMYFDPSHVYGPKMQQKIVPAVIDAVNMKISEDEYLYDGILIEVGTSKTDTDQHINIQDFQNMVEEISQTRELTSSEIF